MLNVLFSLRLCFRGAGKGALLHRTRRSVHVPFFPSPFPLPLPLLVRVFAFEAMRSHLAVDSSDFAECALLPAFLFFPAF